jgi:anti-anti-sigma factor
VSGARRAGKRLLIWAVTLLSEEGALAIAWKGLPMPPTPPEWSLEIQDSGPVLVVRFAGHQVRLGEQHLRLADGYLFGSGVEVGGREVLLDLGNVEGLASTALAGLVRLHGKLAEAAGRLRLAGVNPHLYKLLEVTHLNRVLDVQAGMGRVLCPEFQVNAGLAGRADIPRSDRLQSQGWRSINSWFERALASKDASPEEIVKPFLYAWIALNGWAVRITGLDKNKDWLDALMLSCPINERFAELTTDRNSDMARHVRAFHECWPIFKAQDIPGKLEADAPPGTPRREIVQKYLTAQLTHFAPPCWCRHTRNGGGECPADWPHTLSALYRVRYNLFHGGKQGHSEMDRSLVSRAFQVLIHFLSQSGYMR